MAGGLNKSFLANAKTFVQSHDLMVAPQPVGSRALTGGLTNIDLVMVDSSIVPNVVRLEDYALRNNGIFSEAGVPAYYLPAVFNNTSTIALGNGADTMFTPDLSGCLFAAYGPSNSNLTVEHVNVRSAAAVVPIAPRAAAILASGNAYIFMITPVPIGGAGTNVVSYATGGVVVGKRNQGGGWNFVYRVDGNAANLV